MYARVTSVTNCQHVTNCPIADAGTADDAMTQCSVQWQSVVTVGSKQQ